MPVPILPVNKCFNSQPPEGGWLAWGGKGVFIKIVSTHSRPKAAGLTGAVRH